MRRLVIQIPCYNEAETLPAVLADLPREIDGVDSVEWLVIDDGSRDGTAEVARAHGVDHVVRHRTNRGLAAAFRSGVDAALKLGADAIVNTDGDNQYAGADVAKLVAPLLAGEADIVVGDRQTDSIAHFSPLKKLLQRYGSLIVRRLAQIDVPDTVSGFRAFNRDAACRMNIHSGFSYTIEMLIQAGHHRLAVASVPIRTNYVERESRLFRNIPDFLVRSGATVLRVYAMYYPLRIFGTAGLIPLAVGTAAIVRFLVLAIFFGKTGLVQSLVLGGVCVITGLLILLVALLAELVAGNRRLTERCLSRMRELSADAADARRDGAAATPEPAAVGGPLP